MILGVAVPILIVLLVVGLIFVPKILEEQAGPSPSGTTPAAEDPLALPVVGSCYEMSLGLGGFNSEAEEGRKVSCDDEHTLETIASAELADAAAPPDEFSDEARQLYRDCEQAAEEFLGMPFRSTYTWLILSLPSADAWDDGAHWYRCDLTANDGFYQMSVGRTTGSLRGNATPMTCLTWFATDSSLSDIEPSECNVEHQGELAGVVAMPEDLDFNDTDALTEEIDLLCDSVVTGFLGTSEIPDALSYWFTWPNETDLDQWAHCMVSASENNRGFTASLKGVGTGAIPFA